MFTGIIEDTGKVVEVILEGSNKNFYIQSKLTNELYIDQSISHDGVCLTVVEIQEDRYKVSAVHETLMCTNLGSLNKGDVINLERAMLATKRLDGHFVQGHVDAMTTCTEIRDMDGSWYFTFLMPEGKSHLLIQKGSIAINGVSLTVILDDEISDIYRVAIIPYTYEHTNFKNLMVGQKVNLELDVLGKYVERLLALQFD